MAFRPSKVVGGAGLIHRIAEQNQIAKTAETRM
jgi:hypothetical protein